MKKDLHPTTYRPVLFRDSSNGTQYIIGSTVKTDEKATAADGKEYDLFETEISSSSHPFYTGDQRVLDTAGRADRFKARMAKAVEMKAKKTA